VATLAWVNQAIEPLWSQCRSSWSCSRRRKPTHGHGTRGVDVRARVERIRHSHTGTLVAWSPQNVAPDALKTRLDRSRSNLSGLGAPPRSPAHTMSSGFPCTSATVLVHLPIGPPWIHISSGRRPPAAAAPFGIDQKTVGSACRQLERHAQALYLRPARGQPAKPDGARRCRHRVRPRFR